MVLYRRVVRTVDKLNPLQTKPDIKPPAVLESVNQQTLTGMLFSRILDMVLTIF
jgi:hypothetical protein